MRLFVATISVLASVGLVLLAAYAVPRDLASPGGGEVNNTPLDGSSAPVLPAQACCRPMDGTCRDVEPVLCLNGFGWPQGPGTICTDTIACCLPDGFCVDVDRLCCDDMLGHPSPTGEPVCLDDHDNPPNDIDDACEGLVWETWQYPVTLTQRDPLSDLLDGQPLGILDSSRLTSIAARFEVNAPNGIEVSAFLGKSTSFDEPPDPAASAITLSVEVFAEGNLNFSVAQAPLSISPEEWTEPYGWYSAVIDQPLVGVFWVSVGRRPDTPDSAIHVMTEYQDGVEHKLTWDPVARRYEERDGLAWRVGDSDPTHNFKDPYIRIRKKNDPPLVVSASAGPDPDMPPHILTYYAMDSDGVGTIVNYRLTYMFDGGPDVSVLDQTPSTQPIGDHLLVTYYLSALDDGVYRFFFKVQDQEGDWSNTMSNNLVSGSEGCPDLSEGPGLGPIMDECKGSETDPLCEFIGLGALPNVPIVDPDGEPTNIENEYSACFNVPWSILPYNRVLFRLTRSDGTKEEPDKISDDARPTGNAGEERWHATFIQMEALQKQSYDLNIMAIACVTQDCAEIPDDIRTCGDTLPDTSQLPDLGVEWNAWPCSDAVVHVNAPPAWYDQHWVGLEEVTWHEDERIYQFTGLIPWNPDWVYPSTYFEQNFTIDPWFGTLKNSAGARIDVDERWTATGVAETHSAEGGIDAWLLGFEVFEKPFDITYDSAHNRYNVEYMSMDLWDESMTVLDEYDSDRYYIPAPPGTVLVIQFVLSIDIGIEVWFHVYSGIDEQLRLRPICLEPVVVPYVVFDASADLYWGIATVGMKAKPSLEFGLPFCYDYFRSEGPNFYLDDPSLNVVLDAQGYTCAMARSYCYYSDWYELFSKALSEDYTPGVAAGSAGERDNTAFSGAVSQEEEPFPFPNPRIASDGSGNAMAVWIYQETDGTVNVYYSYFNGTTWSGPGAVNTTDLVESDPTITFLSTGNVMLVVTQNQTPPANPLTLTEQELVYATYDTTNGWSTYTDVRDDVGSPRADGRAELSPGTDPNPFVVWVRDTDANLESGTCADGDNDGESCTTDSDCGTGGTCVPGAQCSTDIWVSRWNGGGWSGGTQIGGVGTEDCCVEPDIALDGAGNALAVWVRVDSAVGDRVVRAKYYNGSWGSAYTAISSGSDPCLNLRGLLWPTVGFDGAGLPVIVFTARTGPENNGLMPSGAEYSEGTNDFLFAASRPLPTTADAQTLFTRIETIGGPYQHRGRWPRMIVGTPSGGTPTAYVGTRWLKGAGYDGFDGEVGIIIKPLTAPPLCPCYGNVNNSPGEIIDENDVAAVQACIDLEPPDLCGQCAGADVNCDGAIDDSDATAVQCLVESGAPETCCSGGGSNPPPSSWPSPILLTDDDVQDWQIDVDIDFFTNPTSGMLRVVWARPESYDPTSNPTLEFTQGFDGIQYLEISLGADCNENGNPDHLDIAAETSTDCNNNGVPDECDLPYPLHDCCETDHGPGCSNSSIETCVCMMLGSSDCVFVDWGADCAALVIDEVCGTCVGASTDCNENSFPDECETDCQPNGVPDKCDITVNHGGMCDGDGVCEGGTCSCDCQRNGIPDECDINTRDGGLCEGDACSSDCQSNGIPDECEPNANDQDCDRDGICNEAELNDCIDDLACADCNSNTIPDECDISFGDGGLCSGNDCSYDCNDNGIPDECDIIVDNGGLCTEGACSFDCQPNGIPDECDPNCNDDEDDTPDDCEASVDNQDCDRDRTCNSVEISGCDSGPACQDCNENGIPDGCEPDCQPNWIADDCDIDTGTSSDTNPQDGIPDECQRRCYGSSRPQPDTIVYSDPPVVLENQKMRYLSFSAGDPGKIQGVRVTFKDLPAPYDTWNNVEMWVQEPTTYCENSGVKNPPCPEAQPATDFLGATLGCDPRWGDFHSAGVIHVFHEGIVPNGNYWIEVVDADCDYVANPDESFSAPLPMTQSKWGDLVRNCVTCPCTPPDGVTGIPTDVTAVLDKFRNLEPPDVACAPVSKTRADHDWETPNQLIDISDVTCCVDAFRGVQYPPPSFPLPGEPPCGGVASGQ